MVKQLKSDLGSRLELVSPTRARTVHRELNLEQDRIAEYVSKEEVRT